MAKINLVCEQCGGNIILDRSGEIGTCESCFAQFVIKQDQIVQQITQNITKHVYGYEGKDVEELLEDGYKLLRLRDFRKANEKFRRAIDIAPDNWDAWHGYASTGGDRSGPLSTVIAYRKLFGLSSDFHQETMTMVELLRDIPDYGLRVAFLRTFHNAEEKERPRIFTLVSNVIGRDESEMASLAIDLCPNDWHAYFAMAKFRQIRAKWAALEGGFFSGKHLPAPAMEVFNLFMQAYRLAKGENEKAKQEVVSYIDRLGQEEPYNVFAKELQKQIQKER